MELSTVKVCLRPARPCLRLGKLAGGQNGQQRGWSQFCRRTVESRRGCSAPIARHARAPADRHPVTREPSAPEAWRKPGGLRPGLRPIVQAGCATSDNGLLRLCAGGFYPIGNPHVIDPQPVLTLRCQWESDRHWTGRRAQTRVAAGTRIADRLAVHVRHGLHSIIGADQRVPLTGRQRFR